MREDMIQNDEFHKQDACKDTILSVRNTDSKIDSGS